MTVSLSGSNETKSAIRSKVSLEVVQLAIECVGEDPFEGVIAGAGATAKLGLGVDELSCDVPIIPAVKARVRAQIRRKQFEDENRRIREELLKTRKQALVGEFTKELRLTAKVEENQALILPSKARGAPSEEEGA